MRYTLPLLLLLAFACNRTPSNAACETVRYFVHGAECEPVITTPTFQSARCIMPDQSRAMFATGEAVKGPRGELLMSTVFATPGSPAQPVMPHMGAEGAPRAIPSSSPPAAPPGTPTPPVGPIPRPPFAPDAGN